MISKADLKDADAIAILVNSAYRGDYAKQGWTTEAHFVDGTRTDAAHLSDIIKTPGTTILKYTRDGKIISCVELKEMDGRLYLGMLTVEPSIQGGGIGKEMLRASEDFGRKQGCQSVFMRVVTRRTELIAWYERHGYKDNGERMPFKFSDPRMGQAKEPLEFLMMEKQL
jgi:ribosomal protein S18 acetylase RimI-like enzyme